VEERLLLHKLLAGSVAARAALDNLRDPRLRARHEEFNQAYIEANEFLTEETARACGSLLRPAEPPRWRAPLVVMDIDGVLDKQIFGFPSTTAAGVHALRLLHAHGATLALNTARPLREVQEYCRAYGMAGGVAEYGAVAWDALSGRARVLVGPSAREELRRLAEALRRVPGVFLNDRYEHSLRAYTFERGRTVPLPEPLAQGIASDLGLKLVTLRSTYVDTTAVALETDKGEGLLALLELAGISRDDTVAIGDSEPDLPMFSVASRSFAPAHISGRRVARLLGCQIAGRSYQPGLLSAARSICHPAGGDCPRCAPPGWPTGLFWDALRAADRRPLASLLRAVSSPRALLAFRR
jgi:hydroxymethylpyrimidine pyrophosphatase-like HAD family hydrolase